MQTVNWSDVVITLGYLIKHNITGTIQYTDVIVTVFWRNAASGGTLITLWGIAAFSGFVASDGRETGGVLGSSIWSAFDRFADGVSS